MGSGWSFNYDSLDRLEGIHYGNGVQTTYAYDCDGNISHLETKTESAVLLSFSYQYDGNGNRTAKTGTQGLTAGSSALQPAAIDISYRYDVRGQLLEERRNNMPVCYEYDAAGNRIRKTEGEKETRYQYNAKNQLICEENAGGIKSFTYDRQGGIVEEKGQTGPRRFTYNSRHQQIRVQTETGNVQENCYDAEGLRYELLENGRRTSFVYHNGELLHEKGGETGLSGEETSYHLGVGIEAFQRKQKIFYYHQDEQLNTTLISDGDAKLRNQYRYDAFGAGIDALEELPNRICYTGQQYDQLTGQYYLRARYYNPILGRFMQEDVYQGDGLDFYLYCHNNPVIYYDPSGFVPLDKKGFYVYGLYDNGSTTPYYIGITDDTIRRTQEHIKSGRLDPKKASLQPIENKVVYGNARGYEQYYIKKFHTLTGIIGQKISPKNRGNKINSFRESRNDDRAKWFKAAYQCLERRDAASGNQEEIKGGSGCQT